MRNYFRFIFSLVLVMCILSASCILFAKDIQAADGDIILPGSNPALTRSSDVTPVALTTDSSTAKTTEIPTDEITETPAASQAASFAFLEVVETPIADVTTMPVPSAESTATPEVISAPTDKVTSIPTIRPTPTSICDLHPPDYDYVDTGDNEIYFYVKILIRIAVVLLVVLIWRRKSGKKSD